MREGEEEGEIMEKSYRPSSVPPRPSGADSKKDGNSSSSKKRSQRRGRESAGRADAPPRRPAQQQQKFRQVDKRPRSRGYCNDREKQEVTMGEEADYGSVWKPGSKKQNFNHLLNFSYDTHDRFSGREGGRRISANWNAKRAVKFNKEQFLQANCQFVVRDDGDYAIHTGDPDTLVEWNQIEQVRLFSQGVPSCPICLFPPTAAKITRCGHIYCWPCMLHYLSLSEKSWAKCPICFEAVHEKDLKSVKALDTPAVKVNTPIKMTLMKRERGSTICMPAYQWKTLETPLNIDATDEDLCFAKLLTASAQQVMQMVNAEKEALIRQMAEDGEESLEGSYVHAALQAITKREGELQTRLDAGKDVTALMESLKLKEDHEEELSVAKIEATSREPLMSYSSAFSDEEDSQENVVTNSGEDTVQLDTRQSSASESENISPPSTPAEPAAEDENEEEGVTVEEAEEVLAIPEMENNTSQAKKNMDAHFFYQASDGQQIFLHSINARCLVREYGSLEVCPPVIEANIIEPEGITMSEELRRRLRYLNHLPLKCEFQVVELALKPPVISKEALDHFADEIERRRKLRQRKSRDERRKLKKMQEEENRRMENCPELRASLGGIQNQSFPEMRSYIVPSEAPNLQAGGSSAGSSPMITPIGSPPAGTEEEGGQTTGLSFAQMLRAGKAQNQTAWGVKAGPTAGGSPLTSKPRGADSESESEDRVPVPTYQQSFGDAIQAALDNAEQGASAQNQSGGKKKKKVKKLLFTTTMARAK